MNTALDSYREHLTGTLKDKHDELCEHHTATWKKGRPAALLVEIEHHFMALGLLNLYIAETREIGPQTLQS